MNNIENMVSNLLDKMKDNKSKDETFLAYSALLNKPGNFSTAAVAIKIVVEVNDRWVTDEYSLNISDCNKSISLEIPYAKPEQLDNSLHKIDILLEGLMAAKDAISKAHTRYIELQAEINKKENDEKSKLDGSD